MRGSPIRCSRKRISQSWLTSIEERSDVGVQYLVHLLAGDSDRQRVQRIVLAASGSEPIREPEKLFLVDRIQHRDRRPLDDLVFERGDRQRPLSPIRLRNISSPRR